MPIPRVAVPGVPQKLTRSHMFHAAESAMPSDYFPVFDVGPDFYRQSPDEQYQLRGPS